MWKIPLFDGSHVFAFCVLLFAATALIIGFKGGC